MTEKEAIEQLEGILRAFGFSKDCNYLLDYEPENYKTVLAIRIVLKLIKDCKKEILIRDNFLFSIANYFSLLHGCPNEYSGVNLKCEKRCIPNDDISAKCWEKYLKRKMYNEYYKN